MGFEFKRDAERARDRIEAWWHGEVIDRACILVTAPIEPTPAEVVPESDLLDWWTNPDRVIGRLEARIARTYWAGEAFPAMFPTSTGIPAITAAFLGSNLRFINTNTAWCDHLITDWSSRPPLVFDADNRWWRMNVALLSAAAERAEGRYAVGLPDLNGPGEVLARLRGSEELAFDLIDHPDEVKRAMVEVNRAWFDCWKKSWELIHPHRDDWIFWMGIRSERPCTDLQCDFSIMISQAMFEEFFLEPLDEQTRMVERTIYHLDGPGATRHLDALLSLEHLDGIQWVPGAGSAPMREWIDLLKRIQDAGKLVFASCAADDVPILLNALRPEGLLLSTHADSPAEADDLLKLAERLALRK